MERSNRLYSPLFGIIRLLWRKALQKGDGPPARLYQKMAVRPPSPAFARLFMGARANGIRKTNQKPNRPLLGAPTSGASRFYSVLFGFFTEGAGLYGLSGAVG
jgi:hypothetical protein